MTTIDWTVGRVPLVDDRFLLPEDVPDVIRRAAMHYDWAMKQ
jgi:hypothetical protein